jgi:FAD dependent oxidoreductase TIGR03364
VLKDRYDVAVVGMGIVGLAHALAASRFGLSVVVIDREHAPSGASVRNFGFVTVTGQRPGPFWRLARRARDIWIEVAEEARIPILQHGLHVVARRPEAAATLEAFLDTEMGEGCALQTYPEFMARTGHPALADCRAVLMSPHELRVEPRAAVQAITQWLRESGRATFLTGVAVREAGDGVVATSVGPIAADMIFLCPGDDLVTLYPDCMTARSVTRCKLQMMRLSSPGVRFPAPLMSDLGLVRYAGYAELEPTRALAVRLAAEQPEHLRRGVHLIAVQDADGGLVVGDSHHYGASPDPFASDAVDQLILEEFSLVTGLEPPKTVERWVGTYAWSSHQDWFVETPAPGVRLVVVTTGAGMSTAFAIAEQVVADAFGRSMAKTA